MKNSVSGPEKITVFVLTAIDILTKILAKLLGVGIANTHITLGFFRQTTGWATYLFGFVLVGLIYLLRKTLRLEGVSKIGLLIMFSGAIGNLIWRLVFGHVIQWIDLLYIPTFNLADMMIVLGSGLVILGIVWNGID